MIATISMLLCAIEGANLFLAAELAGECNFRPAELRKVESDTRRVSDWREP
jgi:hypothetical protein